MSAADLIRPSGPETRRARAALVSAEAPSTVYLKTGTVSEALGVTFHVLLDGRRQTASRAVSCLVEPLAGDAVLVVVQDEACHVLAVLARPGLGDATLSLPDPAAALTLSAPSLRLDAAARLDLAAPEVAVTTRRMHVVADVLTQIARLATVIGETLSTAVGRQSTIARRIDIKADDRSTAITGLDNERIGTKVSQSELSTASSAIVTLHARDDIRLDAKRVTIG